MKIQSASGLYPLVTPPPVITSQRVTVLPALSGLSQDQLRLNTRKSDLPQDLFSTQEAWLQEINRVKAVTPALEQLPDFTITPLRIGVAIGQKQATFSIDEATLYAHTPQGRQKIGDFANSRFQIQSQPGGFKLLDASGKAIGQYEGSLSVENSQGLISINGSRYRGGLEIKPHPATPDRLNLINTVMLEDYLLSVVPSESPASWPLESLKAQAMAARTYAVANWKKREALGFDMNADTSDQMYTGVQGEQPTSSQAVQETRHQIITWGGKPINALFFSSSGGMTDSSLAVWGVELPYIQPVPDFDQASPRYRWTKTMTRNQLQTAAQKLGFNVGTLQKIEVLETTAQGRVQKLRLSGSQGSFEADGNKFRFAAGLSSTRWTLTEEASGEFVFAGSGWGHGLGMSQWGARQMAADGKSAREIIQHYYTGVTIETLATPDTDGQKVLN